MLARGLMAAGLCMAACAVGCAAARGQDDPAVAPLVIGQDADAAVITADPAPVPPVATESDRLPSVLAEESVHSPASIATACPASVRACGDDLDDWTILASFDALFLERANGVGPLAVASQSSNTPGAPVIAASDVRYPMIPGARIFHGWRNDESGGWEAGYLGAWSMHADSQAVSPAGLLALPGGLGAVDGSGFGTATAIQAQLDGTLNSAEFNIFSTRVYAGCRRHDPLPWRRSWDILEGTTARADWLLGVRWAGINETGILSVTAWTHQPPPEFATTTYRVMTSSQFVGPQIGHRRRVEWGDWAVEGWLKAALVGTFLSQSQGAVVGPADLLTIREPRSATNMGVGMIGDLNATAIRRLGDHWAVRAGYTLLWFGGAAPAANQWDFTNTTTSGTGLATGTVFLHGATLGVEAAW